MTIRTVLLYLCFLLIGFKAIAQQDKKSIGLLVKKIPAMHEDTNKVLLYLELTDSLVLIKSQDEALAIAEKALSLSNKIKFTHGVIFSYLRLGYVNEVINKNYPKAIDYYKEASKIAEKSGTYTDLNTTYGCILNMYYYMGDYPSAMNIAQKGLSLAERRNDEVNLAHYNNQLGFIYLKQEKSAESIKYYRQYLNLARQTDNPMVLADSYNCMADVYLLEKNYKTALHYLFAALDIYKKSDKAKKTDKKSLLTRSDRVSYSLYKISTVYKLQGRYQLALQYALNGLDYTDGRHARRYNPYDLASYYINTGEVYTALKDYSRAMPFLNKGLSLSRSIMHKEDMRDAYSGISNAYALQKRYDSAYHYQALYSVLKDSIISEKTTRAVEQIRSSFESDKKDKEIALLNQRQKLKEAESEKKGLLLNIVVIFFTFLAIITYLILHIRNNQKKHELAQEKQLAIQTERHRISGDMHDDIGTGLSTMLLYVNMLKSKMNGTLDYPDIERVAQLGNELVAQMKEIVWSLNHGNDSLESLLVFIRQYFSQLFEPLPYQTNLVFPSSIPDMELKGVIRRNIYLCIKEALNNVIKHANANWVELSIQLNHDKLLIHVKDNGSGFPGNSDSKFCSNGLKNMQQRMDHIEADFQFFNDGGAVVSIEFKLTGVPKRVVALS